jgi:hypothetical protein
MKTYNDLGEVYFVECSNCGKHSTEVNDYWNDDDEIFICDCEHPMFDGWEDEEPEEEKPEKEMVPLEKFVKIASKFDNENYYTDKGWTIPDGTGPSDEVFGDALMQDYLDSDYQTFQEWENHLDNSLTESNEYYDLWEELFTDEEPEEPTEGTADKKPMPERVRDYLTFEQLPLKLQNKVIREDKLFSNKNGFKINPEEIKNNLYHVDGSPACMTIQERKDWYASEKKTETVYKYRLSSDWSNAVVWGRTFEQALSRRGKLYEKDYILNGVKMQGKSLIINKIIEVKQTDNFSIVLGEKTGPFPGFTATVELEDGRITEVSAVVENSLVLR